jgi:hypothetical protein
MNKITFIVGLVGIGSALFLLNEIKMANTKNQGLNTLITAQEDKIKVLETRIEMLEASKNIQPSSDKCLPYYKSGSSIAIYDCDEYEILRYVASFDHRPSKNLGLISVIDTAKEEQERAKGKLSEN